MTLSIDNDLSIGFLYLILSTGHAGHKRPTINKPTGELGRSTSKRFGVKDSSYCMFSLMDIITTYSFESETNIPRLCT